MSTIFDRMRQSFPDKDYRHTYANGLVDSKLATQLKVLREQRGWTQAQLAEKCGMQQARISVLEDVNYSSWSISTLRRIGKAFDLWLDVEWKQFGELPHTLQNMSRETLERESFDDDPIFHEGLAASTQAQSTIETVNNNLIVSALSLTYTFDSQPPLWDRVPKPFKETRLINYKGQSADVREYSEPPLRNTA
jgi:transcriptional regulator with XRE-family HTH domain